MDPIIIGAGISALGSLFGGIGANQASADSVNKQIEFQREMSNTAYQRAMADMGKAGLNPMLAYSQGGASSPQGASSKFENVTEGLSSAARMATVDRQQTLNQTLLANSSSAKNVADTKLADQQTANAAIDGAIKAQDLNLKNVDTPLAIKNANLRMMRSLGPVYGGISAARELLPHLKSPKFTSPVNRDVSKPNHGLMPPF